MKCNFCGRLAQPLQGQRSSAILPPDPGIVYRGHNHSPAQDGSWRNVQRVPEKKLQTGSRKGLCAMKAVLSKIIVSKASSFRDVPSYEPVLVKSDAIFTRRTSIVMCHDVELVKVACATGNVQNWRPRRQSFFGPTLVFFWQYYRPNVWQMTLGKRHFAHQPNVITNGSMFVQHF